MSSGKKGTIMLMMIVIGRKNKGDIEKNNSTTTNTAGNTISTSIIIFIPPGKTGNKSKDDRSRMDGLHSGLTVRMHDQAD